MEPLIAPDGLSWAVMAMSLGVFVARGRDEAPERVGLALWCVAAGAAIATPGLHAVAAVWFGTVLVALLGWARRRAHGSRLQIAWFFVMPLPTIALTLGLMAPAGVAQVEADFVIPGFAGGKAGGVPLSGVLVLAQTLSAALFLGAPQRPDPHLPWFRGPTPRTLRWFPAGVVSAGWTLLPLIPELHGGLAWSALLCTLLFIFVSERAAPSQTVGTSAATLRALQETNRLVGRELHDLDAELRHLGRVGTEAQRRMLEPVHRRLKSAQDRTGRMLMIASPMRGPRMVASIPSLLRRVLDRVGPEPDGVVVQLQGSLQPGLIDPGAVELALAAIIENAVDARTAQTSARPIAIQVAPVSRPVFPPSALRPGTAFGSAVVISVTNPGPALTDREIARCYQPFFSTRPGREGTGLNLVGALVRLGEAAFSLDPQPGGSGMVATLWLHWPPPRSARSRAAAPHASAAAPGILVVDPDARRRELVAIMLRARGLSVGTQASAAGLFGSVSPPVRFSGTVVLLGMEPDHLRSELVEWLLAVNASVVVGGASAAGLEGLGLPRSNLHPTLEDAPETTVAAVVDLHAQLRSSAVPLRPSV